MSLMRHSRLEWCEKHPSLAVLAGALALSLALSLAWSQEPGVTRRPMQVGIELSVARAIKVRGTSAGLLILSNTSWTAVVVSGKGLSTHAGVLHGGPTGAGGLGVRTRRPIRSYTVVPER